MLSTLYFSPFLQYRILPSELVWEICFNTVKNFILSLPQNMKRIHNRPDLFSIIRGSVTCRYPNPGSIGFI